MVTLADIRDDVAEELKIKGEGSVLSAEDATRIEAIVNQLHEWLSVKNIAYWGAITNLPDEARQPFIMVCSGRLAKKFGHVGGELAQYMRDAESAMGELRQLSALAVSGEPVKAVYF